MICVSIILCLCQSLEEVDDPDSKGLTSPPPLPPKPDPVLLKNHLAALEGGWTCGGSWKRRAESCIWKVWNTMCSCPLIVIYNREFAPVQSCNAFRTQNESTSDFRVAHQSALPSSQRSGETLFKLLRAGRYDQNPSHDEVIFNHSKEQHHNIAVLHEIRDATN